ncbi:MFS transporter [Pelagibacterium montanilacus]|uniref:MFS transporter n=1 Tax=Pelagibacterium montanilacus TaxID=2185280 RepID=UPI000F8EFFF3|nr:MFS transporter [Pelagibacterium montanilacus]
MTPIQARSASPEVRTALYYLVMYLPAGAATLLLPIWLDSRGMSPEQIGLINAMPLMIMVVISLFVGRVADAAPDWRGVIVIGTIASGLASVGFFIAGEFWGFLIVWTLVMVPFFASEPVTDAAAIRMTRRRGSDFSRLRVWGTVGFIVGSVLSGLAFDWLGIAVFVPLFVAACVMRGLVSLQLPLFRAASTEVLLAGEVLNSEAASTMRQILKPWFVLTLAGAALLQASHFLLIGFGALMWRSAGVSPSVIGVLWAIAPICEIAIMLFFARLARRFSARHLLALACFVGAFRWVGMGLSQDAWWLAAMQMLHMATFGLGYLGTVNFIANWTTEEIAAQAQSFFVVLRQAATVGALLLFGPLVAHLGLASFYVAAAIAALGGALILISLSIVRSKR